MRLPEARVGGVQSLGREDINQPNQKWRAEMQTRSAIGDAFTQAGKLFADIFAGQNEAKNLQLLNQRILDDRTLHTTTLDYMTNVQQIDLSEESDAPKEVREYAAAWAKKNAKPGQGPVTSVPTHEIIDGYTREMFDRTSASSLEALKGTKLEGQYLQNMTPSMVAGASVSVTQKLKQKQTELKAGADLQYNEAVNRMDPVQAKQIADANLASGAWTPPEYAKAMEEMPGQIYEVQVQERIYNATSESQVAQLQREIFNPETPLAPTRRTALLGALDAQERRLDKDRSDRHERTMAGMYANFTEGNLTPDAVRGALRNDQISYQQAISLQSVLSSGSQAVVTNKQTKASYEGHIASLRMFPPGSDSAKARAKQLKMDLMAAKEGMYRDGSPYEGTRLLPADFADLMKAVDTEMKNSNNPDYTVAVDQIKKATQIEGLVDLTKNTNNTRAYIAYKRALDDYFDQAGWDADLVGWTEANQKRYDPKLFNEINGTPSANNTIRRLRMHGIPPTAFPQEPDAPLDMGRVHLSAITQYTKGKMSEQDFNEIGRIVRGYNDAQTVQDYMRFERDAQAAGSAGTDSRSSVDEAAHIEMEL